MVRFLGRLRLRNKLILSFVFVIVIATVISSAVTYVQWREGFYTQVQEEGTVLAQTLAQGSVDPILRNDFSTLEEYVDNLLKRKNIAYVIITDRRDHVLASGQHEKIVPAEILARGLASREPVLVQTYRSELLKADVNDISVPVMIDGRKWGGVRVGFSLGTVEQRIYANVPYALLSALLSATGGIVVALVLARTITKPLATIISSMRIISEGELSHRIAIDSPDEFGQMAESFNRMAHSLGESKAQLEKTYEELARKQKMAALGELSARMAHEIKNPLGIIKGSAQIIVDAEAPQSAKEEVGRFIVEETDRLNQRVMDILSYARPPLRAFESLDLNAFVEQHRMLWEATAKRNGTVTMTLRLAEGLPRVRGDRDQLVRALLNIVVNAYEAIDGEGMITIETHREDDAWVAVSVADTGSGIDGQHLERIFEPFFTTKSRGTGLGLSIVKSIVESHRGQVRISRREPRGTEVTLLFPVAAA